MAMPAAAGAQSAQSDQYFALKFGSDFIDGARQCEKNWLYFAQDRGLWRLWWLLYCQLLGCDPVTGDQNVNQELKYADDEARYVAFRIQLTRALIKQRTMLAKDERPSFEGVAANNNASSLAKVNMASKAIDYVLTESKLEQRASGALESNGNFGGGGMHLSWNYGGGRMVDTQEPQIGPDGNPVTMPDAQGVEQTMMQKVKKRSGAPKIDKLYPWQQVTDPYQEDDHSWVIIKLPVNKYELASAFPEKAKEIIGLTIDAEMGDDAMFAWGNRNTVSSDIVVLRILYHRDCDAVPGGRMAQWCQTVGLVGCDEMLPCPLDEGLPWEPVIDDRYFMTAFGYPVSSDLLSVQSALNETMSQTLTFIQKHGNANVFYPDTYEIDEAAYQAGGTVNQIPAGAKPPEVTKFDDMGTAPAFVVQFCREVMPLIFGLNPTVQGQPEANISSGAFAVLLVNLAQKFTSSLQEAYDFALVGIANKALQLVKKNAKNGFWAEVAGVADTPYFELFSTDDLSDFHSVKVVRRNPVMSTFVGRVEILNLTKDMDKKSRAEAMELLLDSRTDAYAENDQSATIRIRKENEQMLALVAQNIQSMPQDPLMQTKWFKQIMPKVSWSDPHPIEVQKHNAERDKLRAQDPPQDPNAYALWVGTINLLDAHSTEHCNVYASTPIPMLLTAGIPPLQMAATARPGAGQQGAQSNTGAPDMMLPASAGGSSGPGDVPGGPKAPNGPQKPSPPAGAQGAAAGNP